MLLSPIILAAHPELLIGTIVARKIDNTKPSSEISALLRTEEKNVRAALNPETFKEHPNIAALQAVHRGFGNNPNKFPPSVQALLKRVLKGGELPSINPIVDLYNIISLRYVVCAGAEDLDACEGEIELAPATGTEHFIPLGGTENDPPEAGEYVYRDRKGVICRKLNWREGDRTKITEHTTNALLVIEGFPPVTRELMEKMLGELAELLRKYCGAETSVKILTKKE